MKQNLATWDRIVRLLGGSGLVVGSALAPLPFAARIGLLAPMGAYLIVSAAAGGCIGYALLGRSTCKR